MDATQWPPGPDVLKPVEASKQAAVVERKPRPQKEQALNCPRCNSTNTKFCYYNNYSLSQPRYFCKTCRRYWTEGGTLRNVPVGGGSRKNKRSTPSSSSASMVKKLPDLITSSGVVQPPSASQNPRIRGGQDLNLGYDHNPPAEIYSPPCLRPSSGMIPLCFGEGKTVAFDPSPNLSSSNLMSGVSSRGLSLVGSTTPLSDANAFISSAALNSSDSHDYFKLPGFNFGLDGQLDHIGYGHNSLIPQAGVLQETSMTRLFHPYQEANKQFTTSVDQYEEQNKGQGESSGCWSGMLGGGSW